MKHLFPLFLFVLLGCSRTEYSSELTENGTVHDTAFIPKGHGSDLVLVPDSEGGVSLSHVSVNIPERYAIVFKCQHGKFVIEGEKAKALYQKLDRGDSVLIKYREVYRITKTETNLVDLDFVDAEKIME